jgi:hypothetical protein
MLLLISTITEDAKAAGSQSFYLPDPPPRSGRGRRKRPFLREMFTGASELHTALHQLDMIVLYARTFPYRSKKISKAGHLRYHYEAWVQEVALVRSRLLAYLKLIERLFKQDDRGPQIKKAVSVFRTQANSLFSWFVNARNGHVHEVRLSDPQLAELSGYELIVSVGRAPAGGFMREYQRVKREKIEVMRCWNKSIRREVDTYIQLLVPQITDEVGHLRWPSGAIGRRSTAPRTPAGRR